jgi:hypothetical protein
MVAEEGVEFMCVRPCACLPVVCVFAGGVEEGGEATCRYYLVSARTTPHRATVTSTALKCVFGRNACPPAP